MGAYKVPFVFKTYGATQGDSNIFIKWHAESDYRFTAGLYFEFVSPLLSTSEAQLLVESLWRKFIKEYDTSKDFEKALAKGVEALQEQLAQLQLNEGIEANFAVFTTEPGHEKQAGAPDEEVRLMKLAVVGELDIYIVRGTKYSDLMEYLDVNKDLEQIEYNELDVKYGDILLIANRGVIGNIFTSGILEFEDKVKFVKSLEKVKETLPAGKKVLMVMFSELDVENLERYEETLGEQSDFVTFVTNRFKEEAARLWNTLRLGGLALRNKGVELFSRYKSYKVKKQDTISTRSVVLPKQPQDKGQVEASISSIKEEVVEMEDPVKYLQERRKRRNVLGKLGGMVAALKDRETYGKFGRVSVDRRRYNLKPLYVLFLVIAALFLYRWRVGVAKKQHDVALVNEFKEKYYLPVIDHYNNKVAKLVAGDPENTIEKCFQLVEQVQSAYETYRLNVKLPETEEQLRQYVEAVEGYREKCKKRYYEVYNITVLAEEAVEALKDFKVALGDDSNVVDVDIYQGVLVVLDAGKKAVYEVNIENGNLTKYEDTGGNLVEPVSVALGAETTFVCDRQNGVLYYDKRTKQFKPIINTTPENLGQVCVELDTFARNVYFTTEQGNVIYKVSGLGGLRYAAPTEYIRVEGGSIIDFTIDGNIYVLVSTLNGTYDIYRYFRGEYDPSFILESTVRERMQNPVALFTNPAGTFPIYVVDSKLNALMIVSKEGDDQLKGMYELPSKLKEVQELVVHLSVVDNQEKHVFMLGNDILWSLPLSQIAD